MAFFTRAASASERRLISEATEAAAEAVAVVEAMAEAVAVVEAMAKVVAVVEAVAVAERQRASVVVLTIWMAAGGGGQW